MMQIAVRRSLELLLIVAASAASAATMVDSSQFDPTKRIFGYLDPATRVFTPAAAPRLDTEAAAPAPIFRSGKLVVQAVVSLNPATPAGTTLTVYGSLSLSNDSFQNSVGNSAKAKRTGNVVKATMSLPYQVVALSSTETIAVTLTISSSSPENTQVQLQQSIPLPPDGTTTAITFPVSM